MTNPTTTTDLDSDPLRLRSRGMRDLGPTEMRRFRRAETAFLAATARAGYEEIRTPTVEPLHLFTGAGALSPQMLDRAYSFLDWDGWSGERVVLRPDSTLPAARWYEERSANGDAPSKLCYVQPVYRFAPDDGEREIWQCGVELFGARAPEGDRELLDLARAVLAAIGIGDVQIELSHAGLVRAVLSAAGLDEAEQLTVYDRLLEGEQAAIGELVAAHPENATALRLLFEVDGGGGGYLANLRAALTPAVPTSAEAITELEAAGAALDAAGCPFVVRPALARGFEYYSGLTFRALGGGEECIRGGRYDGLAVTLGGVDGPASGFAADLLRLAALMPGDAA